MSRIPPAMKTLIAQVLQHREDAEVNTEEPDGFNVFRRVSFDEQTSNWLEEHLSIFGSADKRIANWFTSRGGHIIIDFVADRRADNAEPFALPQAEWVSPPPAEADAEVNALLDYEGRNAELRELRAGQLREQFPQHADLPNKDAIVEAILAEEGLGDTSGADAGDPD